MTLPAGTKASDPAAVPASSRFGRLGSRTPNGRMPMLPWSAELAGRIDEQIITSELLRGNPLGDPHERPLWVYTPPGYDDKPERGYPSIYLIQGLGGQLDMWRNRA